MILERFNEPKDDLAMGWLFSCLGTEGGFYVMDNAPISDLLSTATALHGLAMGAVKLTGKQKEDCLDFVDSLWSGKGGFCGSGADQAVDCEYTYYGLMAIWHLSRKICCHVLNKFMISIKHLALPA